MNRKRKGTKNERRSMTVLEAAGYRCTRSAASLGEWDILGISSRDMQHKRHARATEQRQSASRRGYDRTWRRFRAWYLAQNPLCVECSPLGAATEVDHIVPIEDGGAMYDEANLQGLCKPHHSRKTARDKANRQRSPVLT